MSYTEIYGFNKEGNVEWQADIKNAWRGAMAVWRIIGLKYNTPFDMFTENKEFWELFKQKDKVTETDRIVLGSTYDNVIVKKENAKKLLNAFNSFVGETSLKEQAEAIKCMFEDDNCIAIAFNQTSVNSAWVYEAYDEEKDEDISYNILSGDKHWELFDEI